jgi:methyl-accepting chemotaxis protein
MEKILTSEQRERFFAEIKQKSDAMMKYALIAHFAFGIFLGFFYNTFTIAVLVGGLCLAAYFVTKALLPQYRLYQYVASGLLAVFTAQFIYQMHGLFEMHFFVFIGTTLLITYQNWKLQLPLILLVVVHHASFAYLQYSGNKEIYFTQLEYMDLQAFLFHGGLAAVISGICGYWAYDLAKKTESNGLDTLVTENQLSNVKNNIAFANEISNGNLNVEYNLLDQSDELGKSLMAMRKNLTEASQREQAEKFVTVGVTKVGDIIRQNNDNVRKLSEEFIIGIVKYLGINQGGLFLHDEENGQEFLELTACYAFERKKFLNKRVAIGQGLLGQCYLEKEQIYMTKVPDDYTHITSGLGGATPGSVLLMPIMTSEAIIGVMELASFKPFTATQIEFIKTAAENIAASIVSSRTTERVKRLLQESQQQAEEMKAQEEEMRQNMEELQATQEEMSRKNADVERLLNEASAKEERLQKQLDEVSLIKKDEYRKNQE